MCAFFFQAEDGIRDHCVTGVQTCALPILLGGAGGLEAGISVLALRDQTLPPTINLEKADPECDLDYVPNHARKASAQYALSNSFGSGGRNAAHILRPWSLQAHTNGTHTTRLTRSRPFRARIHSTHP